MVCHFFSGVRQSKNGRPDFVAHTDRQVAKRFPLDYLFLEMFHGLARFCHLRKNCNHSRLVGIAW